MIINIHRPLNASFLFQLIFYNSTLDKVLLSSAQFSDEEIQEDRGVIKICLRSQRRTQTPTQSCGGTWYFPAWRVAGRIKVLEYTTGLDPQGVLSEDGYYCQSKRNHLF